MDKELFDKYIKEMRLMQTMATLKPQNSVVLGENSDDMTGEGFLVVNVTSVRGIYPVMGAKVTVFAGDADNMQKVAEAVTDRSGKTPIIKLSAPAFSLSESPKPSERPFAYYNIKTEEDGFRENINYNVAVFDKTTSLQNVNLEPIMQEPEGSRPIVIDEFENYAL